MKKFFLFAAAAVAALTVNAKTISFAGIIDKTDEASAKSSFESGFETTNIYAKGAANSTGTAYCAEVYQEVGVVSWDSTMLYLPTDDQVYITFKDASKDKLVAKAWADYIQPNGKAMCLVITGLSNGAKVTINLKDALNKESLVEGATVESTNFAAASVELTATDSEIRVYSKSVDGKSDAKWKLVSVEVPGAEQGINNTNASVKAEKFFRNGQLIIRKNGVEYNAIGTQF